MKIITCSSITSTLTNKTTVRINKKTVELIITTAHLINQIKTTTKLNDHNRDPTQDSLNRLTVDKITDRGTYTLQLQQPSWVAKCNQDSVSELIIRRTVVIKIKWGPSQIMPLTKVFRQLNSNSIVMNKTLRVVSLLR